MEAIEAKLPQPAPVYVSLFDWNPPLFDNRLRSFHTLDIAFYFMNTDYHASHTGGGSTQKTGRKNVCFTRPIYEDRQPECKWITQLVKILR